MAKVEGEQNVPSEYAYLYEGNLQYSKLPWSNVCRRYPWTIGSIYKRKLGISAARRAQREIFIKSKDCYNCQPYTGGITPPGWGPRNRSWWYDDALGSGLWYYDYFMQQTMNELLGSGVPYWCKAHLDSFQKTHSGTPTAVYRTELICEMWTSLTSGSIIWGQREQSYFPNLHVWYGGVSESGAPLNLGFTIHVYEALDTWDKTTLCWNNQPAIGALLGSYMYDTKPNPRDIAIPIPKGILNFCMICSGQFVRWVWIRRAPGGVHDGYYYMGT